MATFSDLSTFFHHLLEEFGLKAEYTQSIILHTATNGSKEKVFVYPYLIAKETGLELSQVEMKLTNLRASHPGIYRRGEYYSYSEKP